MTVSALPKTLTVFLSPRQAATRRLDLGGMTEPLVRMDADGRCWVYESYRNTLFIGDKCLVGLAILYGPADVDGVQKFLDGYRAGQAVAQRIDPPIAPAADEPDCSV